MLYATDIRKTIQFKQKHQEDVLAGSGRYRVDMIMILYPVLLKQDTKQDTKLKSVTYGFLGMLANMKAR